MGELIGAGIQCCIAQHVVLKNKRVGIRCAGNLGLKGRVDRGGIVRDLGGIPALQKLLFFGCWHGPDCAAILGGRHGRQSRLKPGQKDINGLFRQTVGIIDQRGSALF